MRTNTVTVYVNLKQEASKAQDQEIVTYINNIAALYSAWCFADGGWLDNRDYDFQVPTTQRNGLVDAFEKFAKSVSPKIATISIR